MNANDKRIKKILDSTKVIACVGVSSNRIRPSYFVLRYLYFKNFRVIPINPAYAGDMLFGEKILSSVSEIDSEIKVDMVDIFRKSEAVLPIVEEALKHLKKLKTIWMQIGVQNEEATRLASQQGLEVIQNKCPKIEYQRLFGELRMAGFNTGIISSRLVLN
ncbi:MAG: CoA-binding protein [Rhodobacterales bacterium]|jgi:predicted CoA-binding protein|tara:strand:- start:543 stop:1025 length:483 start_codon:yes stop_codon:yes gene_type:complete